MIIELNQDASCVFCKIVRKEIPAEIIAETNDTLTFVDTQPNNFGHSLVIPKVHYPDIYSLPDELVAEVFQEAKRVSIAVKGAVSAEGINIYMNNESAAGQVVFHAHIHVIPRFLADGFGTFPIKTYEHNDQMKKTGEKIRSLLQ